MSLHRQRILKKRFQKKRAKQRLKNPTPNTYVKRVKEDPALIAMADEAKNEPEQVFETA